VTNRRPVRFAALLVSFGTGGEPVRVSGRGLSWWQLRYAHLVAIR